MNDEIEKFLLGFEEAFKKDPDLRVDQVAGFNDLVQQLNASDQEYFYREAILLEVELRSKDGQSVNKLNYLDRFPEYPQVINQAMRQWEDSSSKTRDNAAEGSSGFGLFDVSQQLNGTLNVNPHRKLGLPNELGKYRGIQQVGQGSFGVVCRAIDSQANELRALKFPTRSFDRDADYLNAVREETEKSMGLEHPNIVRTFGMEVVDSYAFVVQEFVEGSDLKSWMESDHSIPEKIEMVARIANGLQYAHEQEITHCDIKPANILVDQNGNPKIGDFGMAFHEKDRFGLPTDPIGTPAYLAPEILEGYVRQSDGRADIFSLGVVLYEMLAGRKPFNAPGKEVYVDILKKDPKPIRLINREVDAELERICLRCLQKKTLARYQLAADLEEELRHWLRPEETRDEIEVPEATVDFVPRGLRSYTADDAGFFLELLPGVRDRGNVPLSLSFWIARIREPVREEDRVPNAFLFGPSGSGKSSFVKAGLIPLIRDKVETVYVESTREDTEVRILKALRRRFPEIPDDLGLPQVFAGLTHGNWREPGLPGKILLVVDQFEQWISRPDVFDQTQLVKALKHCDGENLQCLMLVRDDFIFSCGRFADALDIHLKENENFKDIDLFNEEHAKKVLTKLGQAYDKLPADDQITDEQHRFLDQTIEQLSHNHFVVCVRLTLFAEMFKDRAWTVTELGAVGGVAGVGEQFLESRFGESALNARHRGHRKRVQAVLEELLPETGRNIRGSMKTRQELSAAAQGESNPQGLAEVINLLDEELKLITRTDPDAAGDISVNENNSASGEVYYQLTHDYLVPSVRDWLNTELRNTRRGRALIRLRELAAQVVPGQKPKYLPGNFEWLSWQFTIPRSARTKNEKTILRAGGKQFGINAGLTLVGILILVAIYWTTNRYSTADALVKELLDGTYQNLPEVVKETGKYSAIVIPILERKSRQSGLDQDKLVRISLGTLIENPSQIQSVADALVDPTTAPDKLKAIVKVSTQGRLDKELKELLISKLNDEESLPANRFRAASAIARLDSESIDWQVHAGLVVSQLVGQTSREISEWIEMFHPVRQAMVPELVKIFRGSPGDLKLANAALALLEYQEPDVGIDLFNDLLLESNDSQFDTILALIEEKGLEDKFADRVSRSTQQETNRIRAVRAIALARLGKPQKLVEAIGSLENRELRNYCIVLATDRRLGIYPVLKLYEENDLEAKPHLRQALLMVMAEQIESIYDIQPRQKIERIARTGCLQEKDAGCFSACELIVRRLNGGSKEPVLALRRQRRARLEDQNGIDGSVFINSKHMAFSIVPVTDPDGNPYKLAIGTEEVTNRDFANISPKFRDSKRFSGEHLPFDIYDCREAIEFCIKLGKDEQKSPFFQSLLGKPDRYFYEMKIDYRADGYRILFEDEIQQLNGFLDLNFGTESELAPRFCQVYENRKGSSGDSGSMLPNEIGLFDVFGNHQELVIDTVDGRIEKARRYGMSSRVNGSQLTAATSQLYQLSELGGLEIGLRVTRRLGPKSNN